ncbi:hypothetical protein QBC43DRAFT_308249 [Cladorrhinum sp. PSN259]|nr:hypothetical protein QBC43DRAFT_308249 [Cladorrhinum sp. PSN259]
MLRRAGFVCRSCLLALSRPQLPPLPRLIPPQDVARRHVRAASTRDDPFSHVIEAQERPLPPNDFSGTVPAPHPPDGPKPPAPRRKRAWTKAVKGSLRHRSLKLERDDDNDAGDDGLIQPPSKSFRFKRIKREPQHNQREKMVSFMAQSMELSYKERKELEQRFIKWRGEFVLKVWPHTQPVTSEANRKRLQLAPLTKASIDFPLGPDVESIRKKWFIWHQNKRRDRWPTFISRVMKYYPHRTIEALEATFEEGVTPYYAVADVVAFIVRWAIPGVTGLWKTDPRIKRWGRERKMSRIALPHLLLYLLENSTPGSQRFRQWTLYRILNLADEDTAGRLSDALKQYGHPLHPYTRFQIATRLARDVRLKYSALEHLEELVALEKTDVNSKYCQALATSIMLFPSPDNGNALMSRMRAEVSERILKLGLTPNLYHYTVMIRGLCENNDFETAWKIYDMLLEHQHAPDRYLYSTLLNGAKLTGKLGTVDRVLATLPPLALNSHIIRNDLLSSILTTGIIEARAKGIKPPRILPVFPPMLAFFARFYKLERLQRIIPVDLQDILAQSERFLELRRVNWRFMREWETMIMPRIPLKPDKLLDPGYDTLAIMVLGFLKSNETKYQIMAFYSHFQNLLANGDIVACELCRYNGSAIHDFVLKAALEWEGMLRISLDILSDMLRGKQSRDRFRGEWAEYLGIRGEDHDQPTKGGTTTRQKGLAHSSSMAGGGEGGGGGGGPIIGWPLPWARKLNQAPQAAGYNLNPAPSVYSWSIILNGAMYHRQVEQGVRIMKLMREHGIEPNEVTWNTLIRGFARLQRTTATVTAMKRMEEAGHRADEFTMRAFGGLVDKEGALKMMEEMLEDMKKDREEKVEEAAKEAKEEVLGPDGGGLDSARGDMVGPDNEVRGFGPGQEEVMEYDRIMAQYRGEEEEEGGFGVGDEEEFVGEWEDVADTEKLEDGEQEQEFVEKARKEVAHDMGLDLPPPPPPPTTPHPLYPPIDEVKEEEVVVDRPLTVGKTGPRNIPKPKIKYFD